MQYKPLLDSPLRDSSLTKLRDFSVDFPSTKRTAMHSCSLFDESLVSSAIIVKNLLLSTSVTICWMMWTPIMFVISSCMAGEVYSAFWWAAWSMERSPASRRKSSSWRKLPRFTSPGTQSLLTTSRKFADSFLWPLRAIPCRPQNIMARNMAFNLFSEISRCSSLLLSMSSSIGFFCRVMTLCSNSSIVFTALLW